MAYGEGSGRGAKSVIGGVFSMETSANGIGGESECCSVTGFSSGGIGGTVGEVMAGGGTGTARSYNAHPQLSLSLSIHVVTLTQFLPTTTVNVLT